MAVRSRSDTCEVSQSAETSVECSLKGNSKIRKSGLSKEREFEEAIMVHFTLDLENNPKTISLRKMGGVSLLHYVDLYGQSS